MIDFIVKKYREQYDVLQVGTGDSPLSIPFYEKYEMYYIAFDYVVDNQDIRNKYRMLKSIEKRQYECPLDAVQEAFPFNWRIFHACADREWTALRTG